MLYGGPQDAATKYVIVKLNRVDRIVKFNLLEHQDANHDGMRTINNAMHIDFGG